MTRKEYYQKMAIKDTKKIQYSLDKHSEMDSFTLTSRLFDQTDEAYNDFMELKRLEREEQEEKQLPRHYEEAIVKGVEIAITNSLS